MNPDHWSLDRRIPIALILTLLIQAGVGVYWVATIEGRVTTLENQVGAAADQRERIIRLETILERVERKIDQIVP